MYINGLVQDSSNSSVLAMELLQSCAKPSICLLYMYLREQDTQFDYFLQKSLLSRWSDEILSSDQQCRQKQTQK